MGAVSPPPSSDPTAEGGSRTARSSCTASTGSSCPRRMGSEGRPSKERGEEKLLGFSPFSPDFSLADAGVGSNLSCCTMKEDYKKKNLLFTFS